MDKLILVDPHIGVCNAWHTYFKGLPNVEIENTYFEALPEFDCMVSAANSHGLMDGGVDAAITRFFGEQLMQRVQARILDKYLGEQPIGTSMIVETTHEKHPFIAHTPTMRIPQDIRHTDHVYSAMWAMLLAVRQHNRTSERKIRIVACPGLGTLTGRVPFAEAARQMALAYKNYLDPMTYISWGHVTARQKHIRFGDFLGFRTPMDE